MEGKNKTAVKWLMLNFFGEKIYPRQIIYLLLFFASMAGPDNIPVECLPCYFFSSLAAFFLIHFCAFICESRNSRQQTKRTYFRPVTLANHSENHLISDGLAVAVYLTVIDLPVWIFAAGWLFPRLHGGLSLAVSVLTYLIVHALYYFLDYISEKWLRSFSICGVGGFLAAFLLFIVVFGEEGWLIVIMGSSILCFYWWATYYFVLASESEKIFMIFRNPEKKSKIGLILTWLLLFICVFSILAYCLLKSGDAYSINGNAPTRNEAVLETGLLLDHGISGEDAAAVEHETFKSYSELDMVILAIYYCVSTITTLGYGDIVPFTTLSRVLAIAISLTGVWLTAVFINTILAIPDHSPSENGTDSKKTTNSPEQGQESNEKKLTEQESRENEGKLSRN